MPDTTGKTDTPSTEDHLSDKARAAKRRSEQDKGENTSFINNGRFENPSVLARDSYQTATDAQGIERIVSTTPQGWQPAPLEASDEEKKAAAKREKDEEDAKKKRLDSLTGNIKDSDRATNDPGQGGSQQPPAA